MRGKASREGFRGWKMWEDKATKASSASRSFPLLACFLAHQYTFSTLGIASSYKLRCSQAIRLGTDWQTNESNAPCLIGIESLGQALHLSSVRFLPECAGYVLRRMQAGASRLDDMLPPIATCQLSIFGSIKNTLHPVVGQSPLKQAPGLAL